MKKKISIIIPVYNSEKYLIKCLESIINQTMQEIEIIIVNDGSTDQSLKILEKYKKNEKRIILLNKENEGVSIARNKALDIATGKYILNIDSDDWIEKKYCEEMYNKAERERLDILISDFYFVENKNKKYCKDLDIDENKILNKDEYIKILFEENFKGYLCNKLIRRDLYAKNKIKFDSDINIMEDMLVLSRLINKSQRIGKINKAYYFYIKNIDSITNNLNIHKLYEIRKAFIFLIKENKSLKAIVYKRYLYTILSFIFYSDIKINKDLDLLLNHILKVIKHNKKLKKLESKKYELIIKIISYLPNKKVIKLWQLIYKIKKSL